MNSNQKEADKARLDKLFYNLQDDVLDEFNRGTISKKEMINIIEWCQHMHDNLIENNEKI